MRQLCPPAPKGPAMILISRQDRKRFWFGNYFSGRLMPDIRPIASVLNSRLNFHLVICNLQILGHNLIFVSTKPAAGQSVPKALKADRRGNLREDRSPM